MNRESQSPLGAILSAIIAITLISYPLLSYRANEALNPNLFAAFIWFCFTLRYLFVKQSREGHQPLLFALISLFCFLIVSFESATLLKLYPVLMNLGFALAFLFSLKQSVSLIETFVRASGKNPPSEVIPYLRGLSLAWGIFLLVNAAISSWTVCCASDKAWSLYNGILAYFFIGGFVVCELIYRQYYKRKHNLNYE